jgi:hypothetical protein
MLQLDCRDFSQVLGLQEIRGDELGYGLALLGKHVGHTVQGLCVRRDDVLQRLVARGLGREHSLQQD